LALAKAGDAAIKTTKKTGRDLRMNEPVCHRATAEFRLPCGRGWRGVASGDLSREILGTLRERKNLAATGAELSHG
jgi:hypothetical protein